MNDKEMILNLSKEILRLQKELKKYKWTEDMPMSQIFGGPKGLQTTFYYKEYEFNHNSAERLIKPIPYVKINGKSMPVFRLAKLWSERNDLGKNNN